MHLLDRVPLPLMVAAAILMLGAPFFPEPHLLQKARLLLAGTLHKPLDLFDVFWHLLPTGLLVLKLKKRPA